MPPPYNSFLLRLWHMGQGQQRVEVEHIGSGARVVVESLGDALAWIVAVDQSAIPTSDDQSAGDAPEQDDASR